MSVNAFKHRALSCTLLASGYVRTVIFAAKRSIYTRAGHRNVPCRRTFNRLYEPAVPLLQVRAYGVAGAEASPAVTFDDKRVQELLKRMTGRDYDKIFAVRVEELEVPKYQLMSDDQLEEARKEMDEMADELLKMPSQPSLREERGQFISKDEQLEDFDECSYVFTDIAVGHSDETRYVVVRETDGTFRHARWSERDRMNQIYFPVKDCQFRFPSILKDENLPTVFDQLRHADILDLVSIQCPPDSADYIRVHKRTHADLLWRENYDTLYSTRHYGPYLWFLASKHQLEGILKHFLTTEKESSAIDIVQLHHLMFPKTTSSVECTKMNITGLPMVKHFSQAINYHSVVELLERHSEGDQSQEDSDSINEVERVTNEKTATS